MTDYTHLMPHHDVILENGDSGTPYDWLYITIDYRGKTPEVDLGVRTQWTTNDGIPIEIWEGKIDRYDLVRGSCVIDMDALREALAEGGELSNAIDSAIEAREMYLKHERSGRSVYEFERMDHDKLWEYENTRNQDITDLLVHDQVHVWDPGNWFVDGVDEITSSTTDEEIATLAEQYFDQARIDDCYLRGGVDGVIEYLKELRENWEPSETQQGLIPIPDGYKEQ